MKKRSIFFFDCTSCGKDKRQSFFKARAKEGLCRDCRTSHKIPKDQLSLFGVSIDFLN